VGPSGVGALSSIAIRTYKKDGGEDKITLPYLVIVFLLVAVMYFDDMDLLHWAESLDVEDEELIENVQSDVKMWGEIVQYTGWILKAIKCSLFYLAYKWPNGRISLKILKNLPDTPHEVVVKTPEGEEDKVYPLYIKIPQPNGTDLQIRTHELEDAVKMLGFYLSLGASKSEHVEEMIKKGINWVDRMNTGKLTRRAWTNFFVHLLPGINWGLVVMVLTKGAS
jgi:hypothetical protein